MNWIGITKTSFTASITLRKSSPVTFAAYWTPGQPKKLKPAKPRPQGTGLASPYSVLGAQWREALNLLESILRPHPRRTAFIRFLSWKAEPLSKHRMLARITIFVPSSRLRSCLHQSLTNVCSPNFWMTRTCPLLPVTPRNSDWQLTQALLPHVLPCPPDLALPEQPFIVGI